MKFELTTLLILIVFAIGYVCIIAEQALQISKTAVALFIAAVCWAIYFLTSHLPYPQDLSVFAHHVSEVSQIIFFLLGAMTLVELIDAHQGFRIVTDIIHTSSKRKLLWIIGGISFLLSAVLDNLTTTILMISMLRKLVSHKQDRLLFGIAIVVAANAGGAWTPIGDVTTTMLWIGGQLTTLNVMRALVLPSVVAMCVPLLYFTVRMKGEFIPPKRGVKGAEILPGGRLVFYLGIASLMFVPIFKALTGLPPFMGVLIGLAFLWIVTDIMHQKYEERYHLRVHHVLARIDTSSILFFLGILLVIDALDVSGVLKNVALWLNEDIRNIPLIATFLGLFSAVIDNVPLVAATMGMYPLQHYPVDSSLWHMIAYAAGTGGSILVIGSAAGVALMGLEKVDFITYARLATFPVLLGYFAGLGLYVLVH